MAGFSYKVIDNVGYYSIDEFDNTCKVKTCFSTRIGGISQGGYSELNLGYKSGDNVSNIDNNFKILSNATDLNIENMVLSDQVHGDKCCVVGSADRGKGTIYTSDIKGIDALITNEKNVAICIFTADCVPVFLFDEVNCVAALCHAGWRGVTNSIVVKTINKMSEVFGSGAENIKAAIGPSIGPCCFHVKDDVVQEFSNAFCNTSQIIIEENGRYKINLWNALYEQLINIGLKHDNIIISGLCTSCDENKFYSYRRDGAETGRMISIMEIV